MNDNKNVNKKRFIRKGSDELLVGRFTANMDFIPPMSPEEDIHPGMEDYYDILPDDNINKYYN